MRHAVLLIPEPLASARIVATAPSLSAANAEARQIAVAQVEALSGVARAAQADERPDTTGAYLTRNSGGCWVIWRREARVAAGWLTSSIEYDDLVHGRVMVAEFAPESRAPPPPAAATLLPGPSQPLSYPFLEELETRLLKFKTD